MPTSSVAANTSQIKWHNCRTVLVVALARILLIVRLKNVEKVFGVVGNVPGPVAEATVLVDGSHPLGQEFPFGFLLLAILAFDFENEHLAAREADKVVGAVFEYDAFEKVEDFKAQMVILDPRGDIGIAVQLKGFAGLPTGIEDAQIYVRSNGRFAGAAGEPWLHVTSGTDRSLLVEDGHNGQRVFKTDGLPQVLNDFGHVQGIENAATDFVLAE